jgi:DHA1 family bicyclomycin/chloramphenicol resistance-like MFS transporter
MNKKKILLGVAAASFLGPFSQTVYTPSLVQLEQYFQVNTLLINLTISLFTAILAISNFVVGPIADRWGRRAALLPGLLMFSLGAAICMLAESYGVFLAGRAIQAAGISAALVVAPAVIGDIYPPQERAKAMSLSQTVSMMGPVVGPVVGGVLASWLSWQWSFGLIVVAGLAMWFYQRSHLPETLARDTAPMPINFVGTFRSVFGNRSAFSIIVIGFSQLYGYYVFLVFLPALLHSLFDLPASVNGFFFLPLTVALLLGVTIGGRLQKRWTRTDILNVTSLSMAFSVLVFWLLLQFNLMTIPLLVFFLLCYGLLLGCSAPVQSTILVNLFQHHRATAMGLYNSARFFGAAIGPLIGGFIVMKLPLSVVFLSLAVLLFIAAFVVRKNLSDPFEAKAR